MTAVSGRTIARLTRYREILRGYQQYKTEYIFSEEIAVALRLTAAQVRKDLSLLKIKGRKKAGYPVAALLQAFDRILDRERPQTAIMVGNGPLAQGLVDDPLFGSHNIRIAAVFDPDGPGNGDERKVRVFPLSELIPYVKKHRPAHAILAVTDPLAQRAMDWLVLAGLRSILSLSPLELKAPRGCVVIHINLVHEFEKLVYYSNASRQA